MFGLSVECGHINVKRSVVLELWNVIPLGCRIYVVIPIIVSSLVATLTLLIISADVVIWLGSANLSIKYAFPTKNNLLDELASIEVQGLIRLDVMTDFNNQFGISGILTY